MYLSDAVRERVKYFLDLKKMKPWDLHLATGVPTSTISSFLSGKTEIIKLPTLLHFCEGYNITLEEFFRDGIFAEVEADDDKKE